MTSTNGGSVIAMPRRMRCAVYTRKSSEEGLDMEFNSLDAQREACEAYIASQRAEGWVTVRDQYDDGGFSGGTLERPALQRLLADIAAGLIDVIVVYKIDRLSRALMDFSKLVEIFDRHNVTFVSVTQSFNTTTSMGRLTLNILLSFAQFEREVIGERIRDKFAASRKKGMWMGGFVPLGYDVKDRKLIVNEGEAATVRMIFERFTQDRLGNRAGARAQGRGHHRQAGQAGRQRLPLQAAQQSGLRGRGGAQGHGISRRARGDRRPGALGQGPQHSAGEPAPARRQHAEPDARPVARFDLRTDRHGDDAHHDEKGQSPLPLLCLNGRDPRPGVGSGCTAPQRLPAGVVEAAVIQEIRTLVRTPEIAAQTIAAVRAASARAERTGRDRRAQ